MKSTTHHTNTTTIKATLSQGEVETILADAVLRTEGRPVDLKACKVHVGERRNENAGGIAPVRFVIDVEITIDNDKMPSAAPA